jgi:cysteine synthase A
VLELIGETPLLRLGQLEKADGAELWAKLEFCNPGFSIKDRVGLAMIRKAESDGLLRPGGAVVEATAGNTGIALAFIGRQLGYRAILVVPERFSIEKQRLMRALGGEVVVTPTKEGIAGAQRRARNICNATAGAVYVYQFSNPANPEAHADTTGPEIFEQAGGRLDALVIGCGSGGTLSGASRYLKDRIPGLIAIAVDPEGSVLAGGKAGPHEVEGIGMDTIHETVDLETIDEVITVKDRDAFRTVRSLALNCGLIAGSSAGANVYAALLVARRLGAGRRVVTVIPDSAERYLSQDIYDLFPEDQ